MTRYPDVNNGLEGEKIITLSRPGSMPFMVLLTFVLPTLLLTSEGRRLARIWWRSLLGCYIKMQKVAVV